MSARLIADMSEADYLAHSALSSTTLRWLLDAPALYRHRTNSPRQTAEHFEFGHIWHGLVLGDKSQEFEVVKKLNRQKESVDADDYTTVSAREHRDDIRKRGLLPVLRHDLEAAEAMAEVFNADPFVQRFLDLSRGSIEQTIIWTDERTGIDLRVRLDYLPDFADDEIGFTVVDVKSAANSEPRKWLRKAPDYGYQIQSALYRRAVQAAGIHDRPAFLFLVQEKHAPYIVTPIRLDPEAGAIGDYLIDKALGIYAECSRTDRWPGYVTDIVHGSLPRYYADQFEGLIA